MNSEVIPTKQRTRIAPYKFIGGMRDPQHHYSFYNGDSELRFDYVKVGYWHITDTQIIYLARRRKQDLSKFKLIKYDMLSHTFGQFLKS